jgi:hypothetical protein
VTGKSRNNFHNRYLYSSSCRSQYNLTTDSLAMPLSYRIVGFIDPIVLAISGVWRVIIVFA